MPEQQEPQTQESQSQSGSTETAEDFWKTYESKTRSILDKWLDEKSKEHKTTGTSRTGGRSTLPGIIADMMFGPEKK